MSILYISFHHIQFKANTINEALFYHHSQPEVTGPSFALRAEEFAKFAQCRRIGLIQRFQTINDS